MTANGRVVLTLIPAPDGRWDRSAKMTRGTLVAIDRALLGRKPRTRDIRPVTDPAKLAKLPRTADDAPAPAGWSLAA